MWAHIFLLLRSSACFAPVKPTIGSANNKIRNRRLTQMNRQHSTHNSCNFKSSKMSFYTANLLCIVASIFVSQAAVAQTFSKNYSPTSVPFGSRSTITYTIDNTSGASPIGNLDFTNNLPTGITIASPANASTDCISTTAPNTSLVAIPGSGQLILDANGNTFVAGFEVLSAGATCSVTVDVIAGSVGDLNDTTELSADFMSVGSATATLTVTSTELSIEKNFINDPVTPGESIILEYTIRNFDRDFSATGVTFTDDFNSAIPGMAYNATISDTCGGTLNGLITTNLELVNGSVSEGSSCVIVVELILSSTTAPGAYVSTSGNVSGVVNGLPIIGNTASDTLFAVPTPILSIEFIDPNTFTSNPDVNAGDDVVLRYTINNPSTTSAATNIEFLDELTNGASMLGFLSFPISVGALVSDPCGTGSSISVSFIDTDRQGLALVNGQLAAGQTCSFDVELTVPTDVIPGVNLNTTGAPTANIDGANRTGSPASATLNVVAAPSLTTAFADSSVAAGGTINLEFTLDYSANATSDATGINFTNDLAAITPTLAGVVATGLPMSAVCGPDGSTATGTLSGSAGNTLLTFSGGELSPGESCTFTVPVNVPVNTVSGTYINTTSGLSASVDGDVITSPSASAALNIGGLDFSLEFLSNPVLPGEALTLRFSLENLNNTAATGIEFFNTLMSVAGLVATDPALFDDCGGSLSVVTVTNAGSLLTYTGGALGAGSSCTVDIEVTVPITAVDGVFENSVAGVSYILDTATRFDGPAADDLVIQTDNRLLISKSFTNNPVLPGGDAQLVYTFSNPSVTQTATDVAFTDSFGNVLSGLTASSVNASSDCVAAGATISGLNTPTFAVSTLSLPPEASCTIVATLSVPSNAAQNTYTSTSSEISGVISAQPVSGNSATDDLIVSNLDVSFSKEFDSEPVPAGESTTLEFSITNNGDVALNRLSFTDNLGEVISGLVATGLPINDVCGPGSSITGTSTITLITGSLAANTSCDFSVTVSTPASATPGGFASASSDLLENGLIATVPAIASITIVPTPPQFSAQFIPNLALLNSTSTLEFTIHNSTSVVAASSLSFTNVFPTGLSVASPPNAVTTCTGGDLTAVAGSSTITYAGGAVDALASCTISVDTTPTVETTFVNTTGPLTSSSGSSDMASATLYIVEDNDNDDILNSEDNCPDDANTDQADLDNDGLGDVCDNDVDGDSVLDAVDNCPINANTDQDDLDGDGQGNACDLDSDNDQMPDVYELANGLDPLDASDQRADPDGDGFTNLEEFRFGTDPNVADADTNNNGVPDSVDLLRMRVIVPDILLPLLLD